MHPAASINYSDYITIAEGVDLVASLTPSLARPSTQIIRRGVKRGDIRALHVPGRHRILVHRGDCAALIRPVEPPTPAADDDDDHLADRIAEMVEAAPEFTPEQVERIRLLLQSAAPQEVDA